MFAINTLAVGFGSIFDSVLIGVVNVLSPAPTFSAVFESVILCVSQISLCFPIYWKETEDAVKRQDKGEEEEEEEEEEQQQLITNNALHFKPNYSVGPLC